MNINQLPSGNSWTLTYLFSEIHHVCYLLINSQKVNKIMIGNRWTKIWISNMYLFQYMYQPIRKSKIIVSKYVIGIDKLIWKKNNFIPRQPGMNKICRIWNRFCSLWNCAKGDVTTSILLGEVKESFERMYYYDYL